MLPPVPGLADDEKQCVETVVVNSAKGLQASASSATTVREELKCHVDQHGTNGSSFKYYNGCQALSCVPFYCNSESATSEGPRSSLQYCCPKMPMDVTMVHATARQCIPKELTTSRLVGAYPCVSWASSSR